ncbi:hypothetical protein WUBG_07545, partial [Wuchereria bancrofti]
VFDVLFNDEVVIADLDIFKEAGGIGVAYDRLLTFRGALDNPKINAFYIYRGPKTDIPFLRDVLFDEEIEEEEEEEGFDEEADVKLRTEINRFEDEPVVKDPYAEQDASHMFIPFLIAFACFFPVLFCLCKL